jgi:hypothetical protein
MNQLDDQSTFPTFRDCLADSIISKLVVQLEADDPKEEDIDEKSTKAEDLGEFIDVNLSHIFCKSTCF